MSAVLTDATKNLLLDGVTGGIGGLVTHVSLHSADPGTTGVNELVVTRQAVTWAAASAGSRAISAAVTVPNVPASSTVAFVGMWSAVTVGTFRGYAPAGSVARRAFSVDSVGVTNNDIFSPAHGLAADQRVTFWPTIGAGLPGGLVEGTIYFVIATGLTADAFRVSTTQGGAAVDLTLIGDGDVQRLTPEVFAGAGSYQVSSLTVSLPG